MSTHDEYLIEDDGSPVVVYDQQAFEEDIKYWQEVGDLIGMTVSSITFRRSCTFVNESGTLTMSGQLADAIKHNLHEKIKEALYDPAQ